MRSGTLSAFQLVSTPALQLFGFACRRMRGLRRGNAAARYNEGT
jgi:hypothetical protein